jgi:hypothetical protein
MQFLELTLGTPLRAGLDVTGPPASLPRAAQRLNCAIIQSSLQKEFAIPPPVLVYCVVFYPLLLCTIINRLAYLYLNPSNVFVPCAHLTARVTKRETVSYTHTHGKGFPAPTRTLPPQL